MKLKELWIGHHYSKDDNLEEIDADVFAKYENNKIYAFSIETISTIKKCMEINKEAYYWNSDLIIVNKLDPNIIKKALESIDEYSIDRIGILQDNDHNGSLEDISDGGTYFKYE